MFGYFMLVLGLTAAYALGRHRDPERDEWDGDTEDYTDV